MVVKLTLIGGFCGLMAYVICDHQWNNEIVFVPSVDKLEVSLNVSPLIEVLTSLTVKSCFLLGSQSFSPASSIVWAKR